MRPRYLLIPILLIGVMLCGCTPGNRTGEGALTGAGIGAAGGGIAALAGASPWWILGGAAIGAAGGAIIGHEIDRNDPSLDGHMHACHAVHYQCLHCGAVFCNSPAGCPNCHGQEFRVYQPY